MAADANRPISSLVSRLSATEASRVPSNAPAALTMSIFDSRSDASMRGVLVESVELHHPDLGRGTPITRIGQRPQVDAVGDHPVPRSWTE